MRFSERENLLLRLGLEELLRCADVDPFEGDVEIVAEVEKLLARFGEHTSDWFKGRPEKLDAA